MVGRRVFLALVAAGLSVGLASLAQAAASRISYDPYAVVDWQNDLRLKTQFHDHAYLESRLKAYDAAGYDVVAYMHYSGAPGSAAYPSAWTSRHWPPEAWLSPSLLAGFQNINFLIPCAEEVGYEHVTSPFLQTYIERWDPALHPVKQPYHYESTQEAIDRIREFGGVPFLAHPWGGAVRFGGLSGYHGMEVYSAYATYAYWSGAARRDSNVDFLTFWDYQLQRNPRTFGIAVNDWYGPYRPIGAEYPAWIIDSGKTIVLAREAGPEWLRWAVDLGAMFAVKDIGETKDRYPYVASITVANDVITIDTLDAVTWISGGLVVGIGPSFDVASLPLEARYLRAVVQNAEGSALYTQPWSVVAEPQEPPDLPQPPDPLPSDPQPPDPPQPSFTQTTLLCLQEVICAEGPLDLKGWELRLYGISPSSDEAQVRSILAAGGILDSLAGADERVGYTDRRMDAWGQRYVAIRSVYAGDINMDGQVSFADFADLLANYGKTSRTWDLGDFNYDGNATFADFSDLLANYGKTGGAHLPEPATLALAGVGLAAALVRRRAAAR